MKRGWDTGERKNRHENKYIRDVTGVYSKDYLILNCIEKHRETSDNPPEQYTHRAKPL